MADPKVAKKDITVVNDAGQTVVVVPAGQPEPDNLDQAKADAKAGVTRTATNDEVDAARGL